jgi:hypothetical protein
MKIFRGLKCSVRCVECRDNVGCVCGGHWWVLWVLLLGGAELEWTLPPWCSVHNVNDFVALYCFEGL